MNTVSIIFWSTLCELGTNLETVRQSLSHITESVQRSACIIGWKMRHRASCIKVLHWKYIESLEESDGNLNTALFPIRDHIDCTNSLVITKDIAYVLDFVVWRKYIFAENRWKWLQSVLPR